MIRLNFGSLKRREPTLAILVRSFVLSGGAYAISACRRCPIFKEGVSGSAGRLRSRPRWCDCDAQSGLNGYFGASVGKCCRS